MVWKKEYQRQEKYYNKNRKKCIERIKKCIERSKLQNFKNKIYLKQKEIINLPISEDYIKISEKFWKENPNFKFSKDLNANKRQKKYYNKNKNNPIFRLNNQMGSQIYFCLKGTKMNKKWKELLGYDIFVLKNYLEKQFTSKMNWNNWGKYWEIDHKIPKSWFNFKNAEDEEFKKCWALNNLQPLELSKNRSKKNYYSS